MSYCSNCGTIIASDVNACPICHPAESSVPEPNRNSPQLRFPLSRILAGAWIAAAISFMFYVGVTVWLLVPSIVACLWPLLRNARFSAWVDRQEERLADAATKAQEKSGKIARYFSRPLYRGFLWIWRKTAPIKDLHVRSGVRVGSALYFGGTMIFLAALVGYIVVGVLIAVAVLGFVLWLAGHMLSGKPIEFGRDDSDEPSRSSLPSCGQPQAARSRPSTDFLGNPQTDLLDENGKKIGELRPTTGFLGEAREEVFDRNGNKMGERRPSQDFIGEQVTEEFNADGKKVGESRAGEDWLGEPVEEHFDSNGEKIGESQPDTDFLGNPEVRHTWKKKGASG